MGVPRRDPDVENFSDTEMKHVFCGGLGGSSCPTCDTQVAALVNALARSTRPCSLFVLRPFIDHGQQSRDNMSISSELAP